MSRKTLLTLIVLAVSAILAAAVLGIVAAAPEVLPQAVLVRLPRSIRTRVAADLYRRIYPGPFMTDPDILRRLELITRLDPQHPSAWAALCQQYQLSTPPHIDLAIEACEHQVEVNPSFNNDYGNLGVVLASVKDYAHAEAAFRKQLQLDPCDTGSAGWLGQILDDQRKYDQAIDVLSQSSNQRPNCPTKPLTEYSYALVYSKLVRDLILERQYDRALPIAEKFARAEYPAPFTTEFDTDRHLKLGIVYEKLGRIAEARAEYVKAGQPGGSSCDIREDAAGTVRAQCVAR